MAANRLAYTRAMLVSLTALGALAFRDEAAGAGRDPVDMTTPVLGQGGVSGWRPWLRRRHAARRPRPRPQSAGHLRQRCCSAPAFGSAADAFGVDQGQRRRGAGRKQTHAGAEAVRLPRAPAAGESVVAKARSTMLRCTPAERTCPQATWRGSRARRKDWGKRLLVGAGEPVPDRAPDLQAPSPVAQDVRHQQRPRCCDFRREGPRLDHLHRLSAASSTRPAAPRPFTVVPVPQISHGGDITDSAGADTLLTLNVDYGEWERRDDHSGVCEAEVSSRSTRDIRSRKTRPARWGRLPRRVCGRRSTNDHDCAAGGDRFRPVLRVRRSRRSSASRSLLIAPTRCCAGVRQTGIQM